MIFSVIFDDLTNLNNLWRIILPAYGYCACISGHLVETLRATSPPGKAVPKMTAIMRVCRDVACNVSTGQSRSKNDGDNAGL